MAEHVSDQLIQALGRAAYDSAAWEVVCDALAEQFNGIGTLLVPLDRTVRMPWMTRSPILEPVVLQYIQDGWIHADVREQALPKGEARGYLLDSDIGSRKALDQMPYYAKFLRPNGIGGFVGILFKSNGKMWSASVQLPLKLFVPSDEQLALIPEIRDRIEKAVQASESFVNQRWESFLQVHEVLRKGACLLDLDGQILQANTRCKAMLAELLSGEKSSAFPNQAMRFCLEKLGQLHHWNNYKPAPFSFDLPQNRALWVNLTPIPQEMCMFSNRAVALASLTETSLGTDNMKMVLARTYELIPSEIELALQLYEGNKLIDAAKNLGIKESTGRQRLKAIFRKLGVETQHQLIVKLMNCRSHLS